MRLLGTAASGVKAQQIAIDILGNNMANANTVGFKAKRLNFAETLDQEVPALKTKGENGYGVETTKIGVGVLYNATGTNFNQGPVTETDQPLDLFIEGAGFFQVQAQNGQTAYTRAGNFQVDEAGQLTDPEGNLVVANLRIPQNAQNVAILDSGDIIGVVNGEDQVFGTLMSTQTEGLGYDGTGLLVNGEGNPVAVSLRIPTDSKDVAVGTNGDIIATINGVSTVFGRLPLATFQNAEGLRNIGGNLYVTTANSGDPLVGMPGSTVGDAADLQIGVPESATANQVLGTIRSYALEQSNVNMAQEMTDMIQVQRAYQMNARMISNADQMWGIANTIRR